MLSVHDSAMLAIRNAVGNASNEPITDAGIVAVLREGRGSGSHLRAIFGDVSFTTLANAGELHGIGVPAILAAYVVARKTAAAANPELEAALRGWDL